MPKIAKIIVGIDAGFGNTGATAMLFTKGGLKLIDAITISTEPDKRKKEIRKADDDIERIKKINTGLNDFFDGVAEKLIDRFRSDIGKIKWFACVEFPTAGAQGARPNRCMGIATGQLVSYLQINNYPYEIVTPSQVKQIVPNKKSITKADIEKAVMKWTTGKNICTYNLRAKGRSKFVDIYSPVTKEVFTITYSMFEHIADSMSAIKFVSDNSQFYKLFVGRK